MKKLQLKKEVVQRLTIETAEHLRGGVRGKTQIGCEPVPITTGAYSCDCPTYSCEPSCRIACIG